jgi:hypothetical protein
LQTNKGRRKKAGGRNKKPAGERDGDAMGTDDLDPVDDLDAIADAVHDRLPLIKVGLAVLGVVLLYLAGASVLPLAAGCLGGIALWRSDSIRFYETEHETYMVTEDGTVYLIVAVDYPDVVCLLRERLPEDAQPVPLDPNAVEEYLKSLA